MECEPARMNASSFADNVSTSTVSFAVNLSRKSRQMRARPISNASRSMYLKLTVIDDALIVSFKEL